MGMVLNAPGVTYPLLAPAGSAAAPSYSFAATPTAGLYASGGSIVIGGGGGGDGLYIDPTNAGLIFTAAANQIMGLGSSGGSGSYGVGLASTRCVSWTASATSGTSATAYDLNLARLGAANLRQGLTPSAAPVAQIFTLGEASRPATDNNIGGANGTLQSGLGTGTGTVSSLLFQTPTVTGAGSGAQTYATRLIIDSSAVRVGAAASAAPAAQTFTVGEDSRATIDNNVGGSNGTIRSGLGTGTGATSSLAFQTPTLAGAGPAAQAYATRFTVATAAVTSTVSVVVPDALGLTFTTIDVGIGRNAVGRMEINSGVAAGSFRDLSLRSLIANSGSVLQAQGADIAAANNLVLGADGNLFKITGNTQVNLLADTNRQFGDCVTLWFTGTPTVKHNTATAGANKQIKLAGAVDFVATADDTLTLRYCSDSVWREVSRAVI